MANLPALSPIYCVSSFILIPVSVITKKKERFNINEKILNLMTPRERDVCLGVASGKSNAQIAKELKLQEQSVKNIVSIAMKKAGVDNRVQLALQVHGIKY